MGVAGLCVYLYQEYVQIVSTLDSTIEVFRNAPKVDGRIALRYKNKTVENEMITCPAPQNTDDKKIGSLPTLLYSETGDSMQIFEKIGDAVPMLIQETDKQSGSPKRVVMSPNKALLAVVLEDRVEIIYIQSKKSYPVILPKKHISTVTFSSDSKQLFIADEDSTDVMQKSVYFHIFNISTCTYSVVYSELKSDEGEFLKAVWRNDDIIVLAKGYGETQKAFLFNLDHHEFAPAVDQNSVVDMSASGKKISIFKEWVDDVCNDFSGSAPSAYTILDPVSGKTVGTVNNPGNHVEIITFSPTEEEVLYSAEKPWPSREECPKETIKTYYTANITTGKSTQVTNLEELLLKWKVNYIGAKLGYGDGGVSVIYLNEEPVVTATSSVQIIGQYYQ